MAVVIRRRSIEFVVCRVLKHESHILDRQIIELENDACAIRRARIARVILTVESRVGAPRRREISQGAAVLPVVVIRALDLERA